MKKRESHEWKIVSTGKYSSKENLLSYKDWETKKNENKIFELEQILKHMERDEIQLKISEKISLAENEESKGKFKEAINHYQEAIKIDPQNSTL